MSNDDILCEAPGPGDRHCTLPYGHEPANVHAFDVALPHDLGELLEAAFEHAQKAKERYDKAYKRQVILSYLWGGMFLIYLGITVYDLIVG